MLCALGIIYQFLHFGNNAGSYMVSVILGAIGAFNLGLARFAVRGLRVPLATGLRVDDKGIRVGLSDGTSIAYSWADRKLRARLRVLQNPETNSDFHGYLVLPGRPWIRLTKPQCDNLIGLIQGSGLLMRSKKDWIKYHGPAMAYTFEGGVLAGGVG